MTNGVSPLIICHKLMTLNLQRGGREIMTRSHHLNAKLSTRAMFIVVIMSFYGHYSGSLRYHFHISDRYVTLRKVENEQISGVSSRGSLFVYILMRFRLILNTDY